MIFNNIDIDYLPEINSFVSFNELQRLKKPTTPANYLMDYLCVKLKQSNIKYKINNDNNKQNNNFHKRNNVDKQNNNVDKQRPIFQKFKINNNKLNSYCKLDFCDEFYTYNVSQFLFSGIDQAINILNKNLHEIINFICIFLKKYHALLFYNKNDKISNPIKKSSIKLSTSTSKTNDCNIKSNSIKKNNNINFFNFLLSWTWVWNPQRKNIIELVSLLNIKNKNEIKMQQKKQNFQYYYYWTLVIRIEILETYMLFLQNRNILFFKINYNTNDNTSNINNTDDNTNDNTNNNTNDKTNNIDNIDNNIDNNYKNINQQESFHKYESIHENKELNKTIEEIKYNISLWIQAHFRICIFIENMCRRVESVKDIYISKTPLKIIISQIEDYLKTINKNANPNLIKYKKKMNTFLQYTKEIWTEYEIDEYSISTLMEPNEKVIFHEGSLQNTISYWMYVEFWESLKLEESIPEFHLYGKVIPQKCVSRSYIKIFIDKCKNDLEISKMILNFIICTLMGCYKHCKYRLGFQYGKYLYEHFFFDFIDEKQFLLYLQQNDLKDFLDFAISENMYFSIEFIPALKDQLNIHYQWDKRKNILIHCMDIVREFLDMNFSIHYFTKTFNNFLDSDKKIM